MSEWGIYTFGYQGQRPAYLKSLAERLDATVIDVRYQPRSQQPGWGRLELAKLLEMRYLWVQEFGNVNYRTGEQWSIRAPESGAAIVVPILQKRSVILLCQCTAHDECHRSLVALMLTGYWEFRVPVFPLLPESLQSHIDAGQMTLF